MSFSLNSPLVTPIFIAHHSVWTKSTHAAHQASRPKRQAQKTPRPLTKQLCPQIYRHHCSLVMNDKISPTQIDGEIFPSDEPSQLGPLGDSSRFPGEQASAIRRTRKNELQDTKNFSTYWTHRREATSPCSHPPPPICRQRIRSNF